MLKQNQINENLELSMALSQLLSDAISIGDPAINCIAMENSFNLCDLLRPLERAVIYLESDLAFSNGEALAIDSIEAVNQGLSPEMIKAIRSNRPTGDDRIDHVRKFVRALIENKGWITGHEVRELRYNGFDIASACQIVLGVAIKLLANRLMLNSK